MSEHYTSSMITTLIAMLIFILMLALGIFFVNVNSINDFKNDVNATVNRTSLVDRSFESKYNSAGGISELYYGGKFKVKVKYPPGSNSLSGYGTVVPYVIEVEIPINVFGINDAKFKVGGSSIIKSR